MLVKAALLAALVVGFLAAAILYGGARWRSRTRALLARLEAARGGIDPKVFDPSELIGLPAPVRRYFLAALKPGQRIISAVRVEHAGTINLSAEREQWKPFTSEQRVVTRRPGFVWDARVAMMPGLAVLVHDAYVAGEGILYAALGGVVPVANPRGTAALAEGELMRFFAEAVWYPTALLPSQGVRWEAVDDTSASATLRDGDLSLTLLFRFDATGLVHAVSAKARGRDVKGTAIPTPWEGRFSRYELRDGMRVPLDSEAAWVIPGGPRPYWRGRITTLGYEYAG